MHTPMLKLADHTITQLEGYRFTEKLYEGSRTVVYRGVCDRTQKPVVVKFLLDEFPSFNELVQFKNQFEIARSLDSPYIVSPLDLVPCGNASALVMEDFGGCDLKRYLSQNFQDGFQKLGDSAPNLILFFQIVVQVVEALEILSHARIIHKDIKPANILINPTTRQVKLIDFSIASRLPRETQEIQNLNVLEGTLAYLSPEQTGRMNRGIDYRSDFYSLGVTCYELLTGQLPFNSDDPKDIVHGHLARQPRPPHSLCEGLPNVVSEIVLKLMAKNAEDRYQSAYGIKHDLQKCLYALKEEDAIAPFEIGKEDISDRFFLSEKLYGRQREISHLLAAFERVNDGNAELMMVAGASGIGKTAIVNEVHKPIAQQKGYFIQGKCDQLQHNVPLFAFAQAFRGLMKLLLSESDAQLERWRMQLKSALGRDSQVVVEVVPELEGIIGPQPPAAELDAAAAEHRFYHLMQRFVEVFACAQHPLVLFLDDLQWADLTSLKLLQKLMQSSRYLLIIGTYRDNEVSVSHPLMLTLQEIEVAHQNKKSNKSDRADSTSTDNAFTDNAFTDSTSTDSTSTSNTSTPQLSHSNINYLFLAPFAPEDVAHFVADTLRCPLQAVDMIATAIYQRTKGNPFFSAQILQSLHDEGYITFNRTKRRWEYDPSQISDALPSDDVLKFVSVRLKRLSKGTQTLLQVASCIGAQFDLASVAAAIQGLNQQEINAQKRADPSSTQASLEQSISYLWQALQEGLLSLSGEHSSLLSSGISPTDTALLMARNPTFRFFHDRIQQAAYCSMTAQQRSHVHWAVGKRLLAVKQADSSSSRASQAIFDIVNHLNQGIELVETEQEQIQLAKLNLNAGRKAEAAIAYGAALKYFQTALQLLPADSWNTHYRLTLKLHQRAAQVASFTGDLVLMQQYVDKVRHCAKTLLDRTPAYETQIQAAIGQNHLLSGVETTLQVLSQLGVHIPADPKPEEISAALAATATKIQRRLNGQPVTTLADLNETEDTASIIIIRLLARAVSAAYIAKPKSLPLLVCTGIDRCLNFGNTPLSAFLYTWYGVILCSHRQDIEAGCAMGELSQQLLEKLPSPEIKSRVLSIAYFFLFPWKRPLRELAPPLEKNYFTAIENGDREYAAWSQCNHATLLLLAGDALENVADKFARYRDSAQRLQQDAAFNYNSIYYQVVLNLLGQNEQPSQIEGDAYSKRKQLPIQMAVSDFSGLAFFYINEGFLNYLFGRISQAKGSFNTALKYIHSASGSPWLPYFYFYDALTCLSIANSPKEDGDALADHAQRVADNQAKIRHWAELAPKNHIHRWHLIEAESARLRGNKLAAIEHYDQAIALAKENKFTQECAIANEAAARFYLQWGKLRIAREYMIEAYYSYGRWGAFAKITHLEKTYPKLLAPAIQERQQDISSTNTILAYANSTRSTTTSSVGISEVIDLSTLLNISQIISREIKLDNLLAALIEAVIQNAGADKCALLMPKEEAWVLEAFCEVGEAPILLESKPIKSGGLLPVSLINQVRHTRESVVIFNAAVHASLTVDPYVLREQPKSILCTPLLNQNKLIAILYLENNLTVGAFTDHRVEVLNLICTQAAISLENARLYQKTQQALEDLQSSHMQLVQSEKMSALGNLVAGVAHEINNPINFLKGNIKPALNYVDDIIALLDMIADNEPREEILEEMEEMNLSFVREDLPNLLHSMTFGISRIQDISTSLRTFSRSDKAHKTAFNLHDGLDSTLLILKHRLQRGDGLEPIAIIKQYDSSLPEIQCFAGQLNQVFMNLIANAIEALSEADEKRSAQQRAAHTSKITIETACIAPSEEGAPKQVRISVADNGPGMSEAVRSQVFDHLFTTKPVGKGTGLGLAIAYDIITKAHGGQLSVDSKEGEGTVFTIALPVGAEEED